MKPSCENKYYLEERARKSSKKPDKGHCDNFNNSAVIENSGNSKNHISLYSTAKSKAESIVKADAAQDQDQRIDF